MKGTRLLTLCLVFVVGAWAAPAAEPPARLVRVGEGWARTQVNAVIFRRNSVVSRGRWQYAAFYDAEARVVLAWVWRETPDVATNHDLCYAKSTDGGRSWVKSTGEPYRLPITAANAEYVRRIPQGSELINQTSMTADARGRPYVATYWRPEGTRVPQYHLVYQDGRGWRTVQVTRRTTGFSLSGRGTRRIPVSRPQVVVNERRGRPEVFVLFRDAERGARVSVAACRELPAGDCAVRDLTEGPFGMWEPTYDPEVWRRSGELHLFVQRVGQGQGETTENIPARPVSILEWRPRR